MRKAFLIILFFCFLFSCNKKKPVFYQDKVIEMLFNENQKSIEKSKIGLMHYLKYTFIPLFVLADNGKIVMTRLDKLYTIYNLFYKEETTFKFFLEEVLNQKRKIKKEYFKGSEVILFTLNKEVLKKYEENKFSEFYNKYVETIDGYSYIKRKTNTDSTVINKEYSIMYYLSINNFYISIDDYGGTKLVKKWDDVLN